MPKKFFKKLTPDAEFIKNHPSLSFLGKLLENPYLFHLNRRSVSLAVLVGVFCAFLPMPMQMVVAAVIALMVKSNLPVAVGLVWISNPITIPPIFFACYKLGAWLLQIPPDNFTIELNWHWLTNVFVDIWEPLIVGSLTAGSFFSVISYICVRLSWRIYVGMEWRKRRDKNAQCASP